jgi:putative membrane protein
MIALPIARWTWGDAVIPAFSTFSVIMQCAAVTLILREGWGNRHALRTFAIVAILTWGAEWLGSTTGFPFGHYQYTESLQPQISGVPLLIPLAWLMMLGPSWAIAYAVLGSSLDGMKRLIALSAVTAAAMTAWDLYLDPQMVGWGFWVWEISGEYFGIPLVNFVGWFAVAFLVTLVVRPRPVPLRPLLVIYGVVWIFQAIGMAVFWGQPGPALFGFVGMGLMLALALWRGGRSLWMP